VALAFVALRIFFNRGFEALERLPLIAVAIGVFVVGGVGTFFTVGRD